ncbi:hypothetical protein Golomagni_02522 [Golovinomyces magnicellulatus]|nr:hypothetical protein Golomagni_02522 [Golovinomyces magnicellulatus]
MSTRSPRLIKGATGGGKPEAKSRKAHGAGTNKPEDEREETLQAVVLTDSFQNRFSPFTLDIPSCLIPLANTPLIEYTMEFLAMSGVADVYLYCGGVHASAIEDYIENSKWSLRSSTSPFQVFEIIKTNVNSVGDAMRDLDGRDVITGDFLLVYGDLIANFSIDEVLEKHRARKTADKNSMMTIVLRSAGMGAHRTASKGITPVFVVDPTVNRCLHYEETNPLQADKYINIDPDLLKSHTQMQIRSDLIDCGIDICTPDVLALWAESFDYEVPRKHFLHGVLKDYELNGKTIYTEILEHQYAARVSNLQMYESVSKDVLGRWTYPFVPDSNLVDGQSYKYERGGMYKENGLILAQTCKIGNQTVLGRDLSIGDASTVKNSTIGRRCQIGKNVTLQNTYVWDDVKIGDGSKINRAIIASRCVIGKNCEIQPGVLLSFGVRIADNSVLKEGTKITCAHYEDMAGDRSKNLTSSDSRLLGENGEGHVYKEVSDEDDEHIFNSSLIYNIAHLNLSDSSISTFASKLSRAETPPPGMRHSSFADSIISNTDRTSLNENFHNEAVTGIYDTLRENGDFDSAKLEFMGLRLSNNATDHQIRRAIAVAFVEYIIELIESDHCEVLKAVRLAFDTPGAEKFITKVAIGSEKFVNDQVDFIKCLQKGLLNKSCGAFVLAATSQSLYTRDVLEEDAFLLWWNQCEALGSEENREMAMVREKMGVFIDWLKQADSESSCEEDSDENND